MRLVLFDIDGTLTRGGAAASLAYARALTEVFGIGPSIREVDCSGRTDREILRLLLGRYGIGDAALAASLERVFALYADYLAEELARTDGFKVLPGVRECLAALDTPEVFLGLVTGNIEPAARLKLAHFDLWRHFRAGAYGSDAEERVRLVELAIARANRLACRTFSPGEVVMVGDSPRDVFAARPHGARTVAVATGVHDIAALAAVEPDSLLPDLADTKATLAAIFG